MQKLHLKNQFLKGRFEIGRVISQRGGCFVGLKNPLQESDLVQCHVLRDQNVVVSKS